ncbi:phosphatase PAP2 family protein [Leucobacter sp. CSA1]|uniref:Phosphatase PAP2 family protein n=1 Tax=Leucobacter chromiisoli TaxID=2796471 RepID=A0A934UT38_9MICO|nr:phosphatase PAP2 family protein [Leucobacter chromiisoli]MBK0417964.1 phosphatase PAP2 family protein [Leucobacter chromiisoli]
MLAGARGRIRALAFAVVAAAVGALSYVLGVQSALGQQAEASVLDAASFTTTPPAPLNLVSVPSVILALVLLGSFALAVHGFRRALGVTGVSALAIVASQLLKQQFLQRPGLFELDAPNTFPSGHMTVFAVLTMALIWAVPDRSRAVFALLGAALLGVVAWQLLAYGWHRPSDVLGALALSVLAFAIARIFVPGARAARPALGGFARVALTLGGGLLIAGALGLAGLSLVSEPGGALGLGRSDLLLLAGELGTVGASALSVRAALSLSS